MIKENISLKNYTNYKIGGPAKFFLEVESVDELRQGLSDWYKLAKNDQEIFIMAGGTNLLVADEGFDGLVIHNNIRFISQKNDGLEVGAGVLFADLINYCIENNLSGLEWAGGLPGTVGGAVFGNAGAFGGETKDNVLEVKTIDLKSLESKVYTKAQCAFDYRSSIFKTDLKNKELITSVVFNLKPGQKSEIEKNVNEKIDYRNARQPLDYPSAGSTFKSVPVDTVPEEIKHRFTDKIKDDPYPVIPAAVFLADAGLKGKKIGDAQISEKQPNFFINTGNATASDVHDLIDFAINTVKEKYGVVLEPEVIEVK